MSLKSDHLELGLSIVSVLCLFLMVPWVGLQCVIVTVTGYTHSFCKIKSGMMLTLNFCLSVLVLMAVN